MSPLGPGTILEKVWTVSHELPETGETVVFDAERSELLVLNPTAGALWHVLDGRRDLLAAVTFLRNDALSLTELGDLSAGANGADDGCKASCMDWYGNARPLFLRGRVFALLGYEIVEGKVESGRIAEVRRAGFAP